MNDSTNTIDNAVAMIQSRLDEIDAEREQLNTALASLTGVTPAKPVRKSTGRKSTKSNAKSNAKSQSKGTNAKSTKSRSKKGTPRKQGGRVADVLKVVGEQPGINRKDLAKVLGTRPNYVYRVTNAMVEAGQLTLKDKGLTVVKASK